MDKAGKNNSIKTIKTNVFLNRNFNLLRIAAFLVALLVCYFFALWPKTNSLKADKNSNVPQIKSQMGVLEEYFQKNKLLSQRVADYQKKHNAEFEKLSYILPSEAKIPELIAQMDALSKANGFSVNSMDISQSEAVKKFSEEAEAVEEAGLKNINISLDLSGGDYLAFKKLLGDIEKHLRLLDVNSIDFASAQGTEGGYKLNINTYFMLEEKNK